MHATVLCRIEWGLPRHPESFAQIQAAIDAAGAMNLALDPDDAGVAVSQLAGDVAALEQALPAALALGLQPATPQSSSPAAAKPLPIPNVPRLLTEVADEAPVVSERPTHAGLTYITILPVADSDVEGCVQLARRVGERLGRELERSVVLGGYAATPATRWRLPRLRRLGQAEAVRLMREEAAWAPDFGPPDAEKPPILLTVAMPSFTLSVELSASDESSAKALAEALDGRHGGLRDLRASIVTQQFPVGDTPASPSTVPRFGLRLRVRQTGRTPLARVVAFLRAEAGGRGIQVLGLSLHGLVSEGRLADEAAAALGLAPVAPMQRLERIVGADPSGGPARPAGLHEYVRSVGSAEATPGGGSVAAMAGALGAALTAMVAGLTVGRPKFAASERDMQRVLRRASDLQQALLDLMTVDSAAFEAVMASYRLPRGTVEDAEARREAIQVALVQAIEVPLETMQRAVEVLRLTRLAADLGNGNAVSDAGVAAFMAQAAVQSAALNVEINVLGLRNLEEGDRYRRQSADLLREARAATEEVERTVRSRIAG